MTHFFIPRFIRALLVTAVLAAGGLPVAARAQMAFEAAPAPSDKPSLTTAQDVAMLYYRYARLMPPFEKWAEETEAYAAAPAFDKDVVRQQQAKSLALAFSLLGLNEQARVDQTMTLSDYSLENKGYLAENLTPDIFFRFTYGGENFALVPRGIEDRDWLPADGAPAKALDDLRAASKSGRDATATFFLSPRFAEPAPVEIEGVSYRVLSADISDIAFFDNTGATAWQAKAVTNDPETRGRRNELMDLYR